VVPIPITLERHLAVFDVVEAWLSVSSRPQWFDPGQVKRRDTASCRVSLSARRLGMLHPADGRPVHSDVARWRSLRL